MKEQTRVKAVRLRQEAPRTDVLKPVAASRPAEWIDASQKKDGFSSLLPAEVQQVWRQEESVTVFEPVQGNVVHAWSRQEPYLELSCNTTDVRAAADGEIMSIAHGMDEERIVRIRHEGGLETLYGNLASCAHQVGDRVYAGDAFATVLEGAPLAFELRRDGRSIDPTGLMLPLTE